jgi:uncharacterized protein
MLARTLVAVVLSGTLAAAQDRPSRRIIDVHLHAEPSDDPRFGSTWTSPLTGRVMTAARDEPTQMSDSLEAMRRLNIVKAVVSGPQSEAIRWKQRAPDRVIVGYGFDDLDKVDFAFLRREHAAGRLQVIGETAPQYAGMAPDDPRLEPVYALAEELDVPLALHLHPGPPGAPYPPFGMSRMRAGNGRPLLLEEPLVRHPKLRLYVMHAGWPFLDEMKALLYAHPQVYLDLGVIDWSQPAPEFHRYLRGLVEAGYGKRIMFGSDQMVWPQVIDLAVAAVESADYLTAEQKDDIFYNNAARFLRLDTAR